MAVEQRSKNVSKKKFPIVQNASFDTIIEAITSKSEKAQCTFLFRLFETLNGEVLAMGHKYSESEIKKRARATINQNTSGQ
jgi:hypothetical protein